MGKRLVIYGVDFSTNCIQKTLSKQAIFDSYFLNAVFRRNTEIMRSQNDYDLTDLNLNLSADTKSTVVLPKTQQTSIEDALLLGNSPFVSSSKLIPIPLGTTKVHIQSNINHLINFEANIVTKGTNGYDTFDSSWGYNYTEKSWETLISDIQYYLVLNFIPKDGSVIPQDIFTITVE